MSVTGPAPGHSCGGLGLPSLWVFRKWGRMCLNTQRCRALGLSPSSDSRVTNSAMRKVRKCMDVCMSAGTHTHIHASPRLSADSAVTTRSLRPEEDTSTHTRHIDYHRHRRCASMCSYIREIENPQSWLARQLGGWVGG